MNTIRIALAALLIAGAYPVQAAPLEDANALLRAGKAREAYQSLLKDEAAEAGNPQYDYLLGLAALEAGEPAKATLVFERVLAVEPNHAGARLDLGRAYFALGDHERARREFAALKTLNPPPAAQVTIDKYIDAMDKQKQALKTRVNAYVEGGFGRDSNVTVGPRSATVFLPVFGLSFNLGDGARARSDYYRQFGAGGEITHHIDDQTALFGGADLKFRNYGNLDAFDQLSGDFRGGMLWNRDGDTWRAVASFGDLRLGDERYREVSTLGGDWRHNLTSRDQLGIFGQYAAVRYVQRSLKGIDYDQTALGASWTRLPAAGEPLTLMAAVIAGGEEEVRFRSDGNKVFFGLRGAASFAATPNLDLFAGAGWQAGRYDRVNVLYNEKRLDRQYDLTLGALWRLGGGLSLRPQVTWMRNESNITINKYDRIDASIILRQDF
ncbi:MAG: tetratricopeptide repeat protein [Betaproteobacteria bacterium]